MKTVAWRVLLNGVWIDTVWFREGCDADYVLDALIQHDRYDPNITVVKE